MLPAAGIPKTLGDLDAHNCLEVIILKGRAARVKKIADKLISMRGVKHGKLTLTTA